jgi:tripartite-type tricarboxylate transporter receptor subunit TctC
LTACAFAAAALLAHWPAQAQSYPSRPLRLVSPFPPGGGVDIVGRLVAQSLAPRLGQPVVLENIGGASGTIGTQAVARAAADGHTLLFAPPTPITVVENFMPKLPYDVSRDLVAVALVGRNPGLLVINGAVKANSMREFIALAKAAPRKIFFGTPGQGHAFHLITELFAREAGIEMTHVPYRGSGPALVGLIAGDVQFMVQSAGAVKEYLRDGRLRALGTLEHSRIETLPTIPTLAEAGLANLNVINWYGVFAPAQTPRSVVDLLERELLTLPKDAGFVQKMKELSFDPMVMGSQDFTRLIGQERQQWRAVVKSAGIKIDQK